MKGYKPGKQLLNGAVLVAHRPAVEECHHGGIIVLAIRPGARDYAIWYVDTSGITWAGDYTKIFTEAIEYYENKIA